MSRHIPVAELARLLHRRDAVWRSLAMLRAYFDASFTETQKGVSAIGGFVATETSWAETEKRWLEEIRYWNLSKGFHRSSCLARQEGFEHLKDREEAELCVKAFAKIAGNMKLTPVFAAIVDEDWEATSKPASFAKKYPRPYFLLFECVVVYLSEWAQQHAPHEPIAPIFDDDMKPISVAEDIFEAYRSSPLHPNFIGSVTFGSRIMHLMLQTADLLAGEGRIHWFDREYPKEFDARFPEFRQAYTNANPKHPPRGGLITKTALDLIISRFEDHGSAFY